MKSIIHSGLAAAMGVASVVLFTRAWLNFLGVLASLVLWGRGQLTLRGCLIKLHRHAAVGLLCGLSLLLCFGLYARRYGLGTTPLEELFYFLGCTCWLIPTLIALPAAVEALFAVSSDSGKPGNPEE